MPNLLVVQGPNIGVKYALAERTTIGRAADNTIQVADPSISRLHCVVERRGRAYRIRDAGSKNGVLVNGRPENEKTLLRNDEIVVGATTFLFNPDSDLKNTRFSNKRVRFSSPTDETILRLTQEPAGEDAAAPPGGAAATSELVCRLGELFSSPDVPLPQALERILNALVALFRAERGCLMQWDPVGGEFVPQVVAGSDEEFRVSMNLVRAVLEERRAVLAPAGETPAAPDGDGPAALCVPLLAEADVRGLIVLDIPKGDNLLLHDVRLLQAVAALTQRAVEHSEALDAAARERAGAGGGVALVGASAPFAHVLRLADRVAEVDSTVLITGETGTGKEMIARRIHERSRRAAYPFAAVNCAAIPETLIESELFGHERGAFTSADRLQRGLIENAHGGTLFLDEIGDMAPAAQTKLLRFLQDRVVTRVGGTQGITIDVRVVAATNADLTAAVREKRFREDLFYRLNVFEIPMPPLRERRGDVHLLAEHFLRIYAREYHKSILGFTDEALRRLEKHPWLGNIRELQNAVERAVLLCDGGVVDVGHFQLSAQTPAAPASTPPGAPLVAENEAPTLAEAERRCILAALRASGWNQAQAARRLDIHRNTLHNKIAALDISRGEKD